MIIQLTEKFKSPQVCCYRVNNNENPQVKLKRLLFRSFFEFNVFLYTCDDIYKENMRLLERGLLKWSGIIHIIPAIWRIHHIAGIICIDVYFKESCCIKCRILLLGVGRILFPAVNRLLLRLQRVHIIFISPSPHLISPLVRRSSPRPPLHNPTRNFGN